MIKYCTAALLVLIAAGSASAQSPQTAAGNAELTVFIGGVAVGQEQVRLARASDGWIISSTGQSGAPLNLTIDRFELKYTADWQPTALHITARQGNRPISLITSFGLTTAVNEITQNLVTNSKTDQVSAGTIVLPTGFFAAYEALAARLATTTAGTDLAAYIAPQAEIKITVKSVTPQEIQTTSGLIQTRVYDITFQNPGGAFDASVTIDGRSRLARLAIPSQSLSVVRSELATVSTRFNPARNPTDTDVTIPATGFSLAGSLTLPPGTGRLRHPAVVLVAGSGPGGRDENVAGIPIFAQLAGMLAEQGYAVLRYDKRGVGQSGGRSERVTLQDYADDLIGTVKWLAKRSNIDPKRIAVAGHSEGGAVAMLAARDGRIARLVLIAAPGGKGADLVLEQQTHVLDVLKAPDEERRAKTELQKKIQAAIISDTGWDGIPPALRAQADSAWFRSLLLFDPAKIMSKIKQPILIVQGDLDKQVFPHHAEALAELARARKKGGPVEVARFQGINHLLVPAVTGEVSEYVSLKDKAIAADVPKAIGEWLKK